MIIDIRLVTIIGIDIIFNKFDFLADIMKDNMNILMILETKLDGSFPDSQFLIEGFGKPFRLYRNRNGGGIMLFIRSNIPVKVISTDKSPSRMNDSLIIGFCETYKLRNLVKHPTCFKNPGNPSSMDLLLTNKPLSFQTTTVIETGLSDFHKMIVAVMKMHFPKMKPRVIRYRKYKTFNNDAFVNTLRQELTKQKKVLDEKRLDAFSEICSDVLDKHAPQRKRYLRSNHKPFMNNEISKAIMTRTRVRNRFLKNRSNGNRDLFRKQRKLCVSLLRKSKKDYFSNLNEKQITDNKRF